MKVGEAIDHVRSRLIERGMMGEPECYSVSEAVYYLVGGRESGLVPMQIPAQYFDEGVGHWFLRGPDGELYDLTAGQFSYLPPYYKAKRRSFYPKTSNLAKELMK